jgi:hypothetical protein
MIIETKGFVDIKPFHNLKAGIVDKAYIFSVCYY